jgi:hypothetical protein
MTGDDGTAESALIARCRNHNYAAPNGVIQGLVEYLFPLCGGWRQPKAQVDDSCTGVDAFDNRRSKLLWRRTWQRFASRDRLSKNGADQERTVGANRRRGGGEFLFADKIPATKVPCGQAVLLARVQVPPFLPRISRMCSPARSGCWVTTGPSMSPIFTSGLPLVRSISAVSLTNSKGLIWLP